jgi:hypothetical protein
VGNPDSADSGDDDGTKAGCQKVDFLFVVDNSGSMANEQTALKTSFPGFIAAIQETVQAQDYHIMVVDSDDDGAWACEPSVHDGDPTWENNCPGCPDTCPSLPDNCIGYSCGTSSTQDDADKTLGCGVVGPHGGSASNRSCGIAGGSRYMTQTQPNLAETFACAATVGISGYWLEAPVESLRTALSPAFAGQGGCNEGFLRDDAILVVVFVSDDVDEVMEGPDEVMNGVGGTPQQWYEEVLAAKSGNAEAIVMVGIVSTWLTPPFPPNCDHAISIAGFEEQTAAEKFVEFVELFGDKGILGDVCQPDYAPIFEHAVGLIDTTCDEFEPAG